MITISRELMDDVIDYCKAAVPQEACGVWLGNVKESREIEILQYTGITNIASVPEKDFLMDPKQWIPIIYENQSIELLQVVGIFHSHPQSSAIPSQQDLQTLWDNIPSYWIISLKHNIQICAYELIGESRYKEIPIRFKS